MLPNFKPRGAGSSSLWDKQHESDIVRKSTLRLETFFKFGVYRAYVEQDKAIHKKYIMSGQSVI